MTRDQQIDRILKSISHKNVYFSHVFRTTIDPNEDERKIDLLWKEMMSLGLIKIPEFSNPEWDIVVIDHKGEHINEGGGWLKNKYEKMEESHKLHRILEYIMKTNPNKFDWKFSELIEAFEGALDTDEIEYLCQILIDDKVVSDNRTKDGFSFGFIDKSRQAYAGKRYLKDKRPVNNPIKIEIGEVGHIQKNYGTIHGKMEQLSHTPGNKEDSGTMTNEQNLLKSSMIDKERRIFQILEYLNMDYARNNSKMTIDSMRNQFSMTGKDFDDAFSEINSKGLIYKRDGTDYIAISRDGEIKFNELHSQNIKSTGNRTKTDSVTPKADYRLPLGITITLITGAFALGVIVGTFKYDKEKIEMERTIDSQNVRIKALEEEDTNEIKTLKIENKNVWDTYHKLQEENENLKKKQNR